MNSVQIIGNLARDPVIRATRTGRSVASFSVATNRSFTNQWGETKELTDWVNVVAWGNLAEAVGNQLRKGSRVFVEGRYSTRSYDTQDGQKRWITEVVANIIAVPLGGGNPREQDASTSSNGGGPQGNSTASGETQQHGNFGQFGDPVPQQTALPLNQQNQGGDPFPSGGAGWGSDEEIPF